MKTTLLVSLLFSITLCAILWGITHYKQGKIDRLHRCNPALLDVSAVSNCYGRLRVVLLGDSRIQQWGKPDFGPQVEAINFGVSGATSSEILCGVTEAFAQRKIDWFVVQVGINDLVAASMQSQDAREKTHRQLLENLNKIVKNLSATGARIIVLTLVPPISPDAVRSFLWGDGIEEAAEQVSKTIINEMGGDVVVYDMKHLFFDHKNRVWKKQFASDALHWNQTGYNFLTREIKNLVPQQPTEGR
jgi:lysophospholipase L1-like esterase